MCFCGPFTLVSRPLSVVFCWNTGCTPAFLQMSAILSEVPFTYGSMHKVFLLGLDASVTVPSACGASCLVDPLVVVGGEVNVPVCISCLPVDCCCYSLSAPRVTSTSGKGSFLCSSSSIVNWILGLIVFRCLSKSCNLSLPSFQMTKVSSTYRSQVAGLSLADSMASASKCSM